ncbi:MAG: 30S ribosomal protein S21 [Candidatus Pacebacteria bacterium]|nr:30S ribosomal protein S21 [Candidatus Paceibacterota bacterium]
MAVIVKAKKGDSAGSLIRRFKKAVSAQDIVRRARDRRYHKKPSQIKAERLSEKRHLRKRLKTLKRMKNISPESLKNLREKINSL